MRHKDWLYKKIYEDHYGKVPKGYHVHHKDGDRTNNHPSNLQVVTPKDHYKIHYEQGDFEAAALLSKHFDLSESDLSKLSKKLSEKGKAYWRDHPERKIQNSNYMKKRWKDNWEELAEQARKNGRGHIPWNKGIKLPGTGFPKGNTYGNANKGRKFLP